MAAQICIYLLGIVSFVSPVSKAGPVDPSVHAQCKGAVDYVGCINAYANDINNSDFYDLHQLVTAMREVSILLPSLTTLAVSYTHLTLPTTPYV